MNPSDAEIAINQAAKKAALILWRNVANGVNDHGSFLRAFGTAYINADSENQNLLYPVGLELIGKYKLIGREYFNESGLDPKIL